MQPDTKQRKPAMEVRDLFFSYGKNKVLKGTSFAIEEGKITTIMGANGCGKSTLFNLMTKNLCPGKGNIFLHGKKEREYLPPREEYPEPGAEGLCKAGVHCPSV